MFVAVVPPEPVVEDLDAFLDVRRQAAGAPRWSAAHQWHVTLAFMAEAPERVVEELVDGVTAAAARTPRMTVSLRGGDCFPDVARARVLVAGIGGGEALTPLARAVRSACSVAGAAPDGGPFRPHLTLGRFGRPTEATRWVRLLDTYRGPSWTVEDLAVVASHLPRERGHRPRHEVLAEVPLSG